MSEHIVWRVFKNIYQHEGPKSHLGTSLWSPLPPPLQSLIANLYPAFWGPSFQACTLWTTVFAGQWVICRKGPGVHFLNCISWGFWCHFPYWPSPLSSRYAQEQEEDITCACCLYTCADAGRNLQMISWNSCTQAGMKRIPPCLRMQSNTGLFKLIYIHINCLKDSLLETGSTSSSWQPVCEWNSPNYVPQNFPAAPKRHFRSLPYQYEHRQTAHQFLQPVNHWDCSQIKDRQEELLSTMLGLMLWCHHFVVCLMADGLGRTITQHLS